MAMTATVLQDIRTDYPSMLDKWELRPELYGLIRKGISNTTNPNGIISPDVIAKSKDSWGRLLTIPVMSRSASSNGTGLGCTFTGTESISGLVNVTYVTISNGFEMQPAKNTQNQIKYRPEFARKYADMIREMAQAVNAAIDTSLTAVIENVYTSSYIGALAKYGAIGANGAIQVSLANRADFFNDLVDIMASDDIFPQLDVMSTINLRGIVSKLFAQGEANAENTQYQFTQGDYNFNFDKAVTIGALAPTDASAYFMPVGAYGILTNNTPDCLANNIAEGHKQFGTLFDPTLGMLMDTLYYTACGPITPESGNVKDVTAVREYHQASVNFAIITPFEDAQSGVIRKFDLLTA